jgi:hypothetical protein
MDRFFYVNTFKAIQHNYFQLSSFIELSTTSSCNERVTDKNKAKGVDLYAY